MRTAPSVRFRRLTHRSSLKCSTKPIDGGRTEGGKSLKLNFASAEHKKCISSQEPSKITNLPQEGQPQHSSTQTAPSKIIKTSLLPLVHKVTKQVSISEFKLNFPSDACPRNVNGNVRFQREGNCWKGEKPSFYDLGRKKLLN